jgi:dUTP pyrophosphatase
MDAKFVKLRDTAVVPTKGSEKAAGYDIYAAEEAIIRVGSTELIPTGLAIQPPEGFCVKLYARSGLAAKRGLRPANCVGICDEDYTGEYMVALHNDSPSVQYIKAGERIAQMTFEPYYSVNFVEVESLDETERGAGGFGSTGTK